MHKATISFGQQYYYLFLEKYMKFFFNYRNIFLSICFFLVTFEISAEENNQDMKASPEGEFVELNLSKVDQGKKYMIVTADKRASKAAEKILENGGNAIDAAIAAQMVLNLVEPQSSGIGGGGFLLYYNAKKNELLAFDGREKAPIKYNTNIFLKENGKKKGFIEAVSGGLAVGVPSLLPMLEMAHQKYGFLNWKILFSEAIHYAENGFIVGKRLSYLLKRAPHLTHNTNTKTYFNMDEGGLNQGEKIQNLELAKTFKLISKLGSKALLDGEVANAIIEATGNSHNPGLLIKEDFSLVSPRVVKPLCNVYKGWKVCSMGPPSSGGITILQILGIMSNFKIESDVIENDKYWHLFFEASKLAYADRDFYIADEQYQLVPISSMLDSKYLKSRASSINFDGINSSVGPGSFDIINSKFFGKDTTSEFDSTTHISIIDQFGNGAALTSSIEFMFGSGIMTSGFLLNNQMTDFSFYPKDLEGRLIANRPDSMKKPRSSMSPTFLLDNNNNLRMVLGSPGGSRIICYVAASLLRYIDLGMSIKDIVQSPNVCNRGSYTTIEKGPKGDLLAKNMEEYGHEIKRKKMVSGIHIVYRDDEGMLWGAADPRREGASVGK